MTAPRSPSPSIRRSMPGLARVASDRAHGDRLQAPGGRGRAHVHAGDKDRVTSKRRQVVVQAVDCSRGGRVRGARTAESEAPPLDSALQRAQAGRRHPGSARGGRGLLTARSRPSASSGTFSRNGSTPVSPPDPVLPSMGNGWERVEECFNAFHTHPQAWRERLGNGLGVLAPGETQ